MTGSWMQEGRVGVSAPADRSTSTAEASTDGHLRQEAPENGRDVVRRMRDGVPIDVLAVLREAESEPRRQHTLRARARARRGRRRRTLGGESNSAWMSFIRFELPETRNVPSTSVAFSFRYRPLQQTKRKGRIVGPGQLASLRPRREAALNDVPARDDGRHDAPDEEVTVRARRRDGDGGVGDGLAERHGEDGLPCRVVQGTSRQGGQPRCSSRRRRAPGNARPAAEAAAEEGGEGAHPWTHPAPPCPCPTTSGRRPAQTTTTTTHHRPCCRP